MTHEGSSPAIDYPPIPAAVTGPKGRCPRCGQGRLFRGFLSLNERCARCGLDFRFIDTGDGPAVFVIFIVSFVIVGMAVAVDFAFQPPLWLHALIWWPLILIMCLALLRPLKGMLIAVQYATKAAEGRLEQTGTGDGAAPGEADIATGGGHSD